MTNKEIIEKVFGELEFIGDKIYIGSEEYNIRKAIEKALTLADENHKKEIEELKQILSTVKIEFEELKNMIVAVGEFKKNEDILIPVGDNLICENCGESKGVHLVKNNMRDLMCPNPTTKNQKFKFEDE